MKKILSFTLVLILILSTCLAVSAVDSDTALEQKFYDYCADVLPEDKKPAEGDKVKIQVSMELNGATYFLGRCEWLEINGEECLAFFDDDILRTNITFAPYDLGVYMSSGDEIYTLAEAYEAGYITDVTLLKPEFNGWIRFYTKHISNPENKYEDEFIFLERIGDSEDYWDLPYTYYEGYEYFSPDNTATGDEATADYVLITYYTNLYLNAPTIRVIGDYVMMDSPSTHCPYEFGKCIYVPAESRVYSISEAYRIQLEGIEKVFTEGGLGKRIGDMDKDRIITIKDATYIQKCIAGLEQFELGDDLGEWVYSANADKRIPRFLSDFNRDGERNIKDATAIQKHIAGLEY